MPHLDIPAIWLVNQALLLFRMAGLVTFVPLPGLNRVFPAPKIVLAAALALALGPSARVGLGAEAIASPAAVWLLAGAIVSELSLGIGIGVGVRLLLEAFGLSAQILGFQAGYSYVNMVDPTSEVDASILNVLLALLANLLLFTMDLHLFLIRALADSLAVWPLGSFVLQPVDALAVVELSAQMLETAVRLALPVMAVLLLIDLTLGVLNQVHSRMQLLQLAFPAKIVAGTALLYPTVTLAPGVFRSFAESAMEWILALIAR